MIVLGQVGDCYALVQVKSEGENKELRTRKSNGWVDHTSVRREEGEGIMECDFLMSCIWLGDIFSEDEGDACKDSGCLSWPGDIFMDEVGESVIEGEDVCGAAAGITGDSLFTGVVVVSLIRVALFALFAAGELLSLLIVLGGCSLDGCCCLSCFNLGRLPPEAFFLGFSFLALPLLFKEGNIFAIVKLYSIPQQVIKPISTNRAQTSLLLLCVVETAKCS